MKKHQGFSLIELMIVVAIIGILVAIAIPSYQGYTSKAKFTEVVQALSPFKLAVETCAHTTEDLSACVNVDDGSGQNGIPPAINNADTLNTYVKSVSVASGNGNSVKIIGTSQHIGKKTDAYTYVLDGTMQDNSQVLWSKDSISTCVAAGLC